MRPVVTDRVAWSVGLTVYRRVSIVSPAKTAEPIKTSFVLWTRGPRNHVLDGGALLRNLANTIEPSMSGDAAFCQITLTTC